MMKNNRIYSRIVIAGFLFFLVACSKNFTELSPVSNANSDNFYRTQADFELGVNAAMNTLYSIYAPEGPVSYAGELMSDNTTVYVIAGSQADKQAFRDYVVQSTNSMVYSFWKQYYSALFAVNTVLDKLPAADLPAAYKDEVESEMRFLRGLYYFNMVRMWGGVPLVTKPVSASESYSILRSTEDDVYKQIKEDLLFAVNKLPTTAKVIGRPTKAAAQTVLGEVYLTVGDKTNATAQLQAVYGSTFSLLSTYASLWGPTVKNTKEAILEIQYASNASAGTYSPYCQVFYPNVNVLGFSGGGMNQVTDDLYNEYETGDPRRDVTISLGYQSGGIFQPQKFCQKWAHYNATITSTTLLANNDFVIYRYADLLLMLTEATGDAKYLNEVRTRAGLPLWGTANYPIAKYATLPLALEHEARVEQAVEFKRWFMLKRTGRALAVLAAKGKAVTADKLLLPIPNIVRLQNDKITQNPGYN